ncbi:MAG: hypothetical protein QNJ41_09530 [Xenococcaceae cyanobacterium MO_188.B32]|nr:hypothetical protein [Xenococcaceae cyanobacterium MO_188.B32]
MLLTSDRRKLALRDRNYYLFRDIKTFLYPQEEDNYILSALQFLTRQD